MRTSPRGLIGLLLVVALAASCAASREYVCPDPVGKIIQDDCEVYRTKYESLKVELGASFAGLGVKTSLGQASLRDPSELLQVLSHRTLALCKDFNACRVPPLEYRQRRERTDHVFTAVSTIQEQLKGQLDAESKAKLVQELVRVLSEDVSAPPPTPAATGGGSSRATPHRRPGFYRSSAPWYDTRLLPPQPRSLAGFPSLAGVHLRLEHVFRREGDRGFSSYRPRATLYLLGKVDADDLVSVDWGGRSSDCPVGRGDANGLAVLNCEPPRKFSLKGPSFTIRATFRRGSDGKAVPLGQRSASVLSRHPEDTVEGNLDFGLDLDPLAREGRLIFRPLEGMPPDLEQPSIFVVLKLRKHMPATARCWVNGQPATPGLSPSRYSGQEGTFQDLPRYRQVKPGSSVAVANPFIEWWHYDFPLPFVVQRGAAPIPEGMRAWPLAGKWRCVVSVEGEPVRELTFKVGSDGRLDPHPRQLEQADPGWLVETRLLKNPHEVELR